MIQLRGVVKVAASARAVRILDGIDLQVSTGETIGLCGPGGSGKSLLCKIVCGLVPPTAGSVEVFGVALQDARAGDLRDVQRRIGTLFQNNALFDSLSVFDNVAFPLRQAAIAKRAAPDEQAIAARVRAALQGVGLLQHIDLAPGKLSGGQRKRVALARAVVLSPPLLVYDEPTPGLDPVTTAKVYELLRAERAASSPTVLIVSSDIEALCSFAPRLLVLHQGKLRYDGPAATVKDASDPIVRQFVRGELEGPL